MSGYGNDAYITNQTKSVVSKTFIVLVIIFSVILLIELLIFVFVIGTSWKTYKQKVNNYKVSIWVFATSLPPLKKVFIVSAFTILTQSSAAFFIDSYLKAKYDDRACSLIMFFIGPFSYNISMVTVYLYLWTRQYLIHFSPLLKNVLPKWLPRMSKASLLLTILYGLLPLIGIVQYSNGVIYAVYRNGECQVSDTAFEIYPALFIGFTFANQVIYVTLFYVTLKLHQKANKAITENQNKSNNLAKRCFKLTMVTIISDIFSMVGLVFIGKNEDQIYVGFITRINLFFNLLCMLFCFNSIPETLKKFIAMMTCNHVVLESKNDETTDSKFALSKSRAKAFNSYKVEEV